MLTLYVKHRCPWCIDAINYLQQREIEFHTIDVIEDAAAYQRMQEISGQSLTPTLEVPNVGVLPDFDISQLEKFLKKHNIK